MKLEVGGRWAGGHNQQARMEKEAGKAEWGPENGNATMPWATLSVHGFVSEGFPVSQCLLKHLCFAPGPRAICQQPSSPGSARTTILPFMCVAFEVPLSDKQND